MVELEEEVIFETITDQVEFNTRTNGDLVLIKELRLTQTQAASLAWLVNHDPSVTLQFEVKVKGE